MRGSSREPRQNLSLRRILSYKKDLFVWNRYRCSLGFAITREMKVPRNVARNSADAVDRTPHYTGTIVPIEWSLVGLAASRFGWKPRAPEHIAP